MIEIKLKAFIDVLKANNLTKSKLLHGKTRVILDLDSLFMIYGGQEIDVKRQSMNYTIIKKPTNRLSVVIIIIVELVNQINPKYNWHDIQKSIRNLCKNNDERALLLGFNSLESAKNITSSIKDKKA